MSQVKTLPITATRWLSLLLCAITAATITVFLSKVGFVQKTYSSWSAILHGNPVLHYSSAFLAGIGVKLLLDKFYISHPQRSIGFSWRYPPVTVSLWLSVILIGAIFYLTSNQKELIAATSCFKYFIVLILGSSIITAYQQSNERISLNLVVCFSLIAATSTVFIYWHISQAGFSWPLFVTVDVYIFIAIFLTSKYINECIKAKWNRNQITLERTPSINSGDFKTLDQFKSWFKDDSTIKSTDQLEADLKVYAKRITERLQNGGDKYEKDLAQHIALCGPYGCGKSSIVESIVNDLAKKSEKESVWIHSDISTWGAASGSVAHVVLSNIIDDISQYIDMCAFRALPKHYTEALKSGGSVFQFASTLLAGSVDTDIRFQKLNDVLETTNHKLLITLQDVDRGTGEENEKRLNGIAALLDRLKDKNLNNFNFIIVMGNSKKEEVEVLGKIADHIENIVVLNHTKLICRWAELNTEEIFNNHMRLSGHISSVNFKSFIKSEPLSFNPVTYKPAKISSNLISSIRVLKRIMRRVDSCWTKGRLLGEVSFDSLLLLMILREFSPSTVNILINEYKKIGSLSPLDGNYEAANPFVDLYKRIISKVNNNPEQYELELLLKYILGIDRVAHQTLFRHQNIFNQTKTINYLGRILLENVPVLELRDQDVFKEFLEATLDSISSLSKKVLDNEDWAISFTRFGDIFNQQESTEAVSTRKSLALALISKPDAKNIELLLKSNALEKLLIKVTEKNDLEEVLNRLLLITSSNNLVDIIMKKHFDVFSTISDCDLSNVEFEKINDLNEVVNLCNLHTQNIDLIDFLVTHLEHLSVSSINIFICYITIQKFINLEQSYLEEYAKSHIEITQKVQSHKAYKLLGNFVLDSVEKSNLVNKLVKKFSPEEKIILKKAIEKLPNHYLEEVDKRQIINDLELK